MAGEFGVIWQKPENRDMRSALRCPSLKLVPHEPVFIGAGKGSNRDEAPAADRAHAVFLAIAI